MKKLLLLIAFSLLIINTFAQNFQWAKKFGGTGSAYGFAIATDVSGNIYTAGSFLGTADFDPGVGIYNLTPAGAFDIYISKISSTGNFLWAKQMGGTGIEQPFSLALDASGNIYTTGYFEGTADFDPGPGTFNLTSAGGYDIFISKLNASGNFLWAKRIGGTTDDFGNSISIDASGNVYTTGKFQGTVDFNPGSGTFNLTAGGGYDIFISKLSSSGGFLWAKQIGDTLDDFGGSVSTDTSGNIYTIGDFSGTVDFDPGVGVSDLTSAGLRDIFITKMSAAGNLIWVKRIGGTGQDEGSSIMSDASGNIYTTGYFSGTVDFDPGAGIVNLTAVGNFDIFISKLNSSGNLVWVKRIGGSLSEIGSAISKDPAGNIFITGYFQGIVDFDPSAIVVNLGSSGNYDIFVYKSDSAGNFIWAKNMGGGSDDKGTSIAVDASENVYTTGQFQANADFDPGNAVYSLSSAGSNSSFISKLGTCSPPVLVNITPVSPSICLGGCTTLTATGATSFTWSPSTGLSATTGGSVTACPTVSTVYTVTGTNVNGCTTGNNTILVTVNSVPLVSPSGPSSICPGSSLVLTTVPAGTTYQWKKNGIDIPGATAASYTVTTAGSYSAFVIYTCGAYTTSSNNITLNTNPNSTITVTGDTTFCSGDSVMLNATTSSNRSYQWYLNGISITGATLPVFSAKTSGSYQVKVTNTITGCNSITPTGINVTVNPIPTAAFTANGPVSFCSGGSVTFTATEIGPTFQWIRNNVDIAGATGQTYYVTTSGTYKVRAYNSQACSKTSAGVVVTVNNNPSSTVTASGPLSFCAGDSVVLAAPTGNSFTYQWKKNGNNVSGAINRKYTAKNAGTYKVTVTKSTSGCSATSAGKIVTVPCRINSNETRETGICTIYPNPSTGNFTIEFPVPVQEGVLVVYDIFGKEVHRETIQNALRKEIITESIIPGEYFVKVIDGEKIYCRKLIIQQN